MTMLSLIQNTKFEQNFKMTMLSLIEKYRILTKFQNDYSILNSPPISGSTQLLNRFTENITINMFWINFGTKKD